MMDQVGVLIKLSPEIHSELKKGCSHHERSLQKTIAVLLQGWIQNGMPDPLTYGSALTDSLEERLASMEKRIQSLETSQ